jgi:hypothetical protein
VSKPTVEEVQVQLAHSFHDAREWVSTALPGPVGGAVNDALFLVRRLGCERCATPPSSARNGESSWESLCRNGPQ